MARKSDERPALVLFRRDLRVADNLALIAAARDGSPVIPLFIFEESERGGPRALGGASLWWLHTSLESLSERISNLGAKLILRRGATQKIVLAVLEETGTGSVYWNRRFDPAGAHIDNALAEALKERGISGAQCAGQLLHDPAKLRTKTGGPYKVYTPFWKALSEYAPFRDPADAPDSLNGYSGRVSTEKLSDWHLLPTRPDWAGGMRDEWTPGEDGAQERLDDFLSDRIRGYGEGRDIPGKDTTSRLSPHLAFGEITPAQIMSALEDGRRKLPPGDKEKFRKEIGWRDFCHHLLWHNPKLATDNYDDTFDAMQWSGRKYLKAWQRGQTGYPIVDAGMRELWQTGVMQNRVRMIAASFLIKHLMIDWREGEAWFWDTLVDADPASNPGNWQWVAGSGADASPFFRVFNPILQGEKFDKDGDYVRRHVPELEKLPAKYIHKPWTAPADILREAGVKLGETYPVPLVEHDEARQRALSAYKKMRGKA